MYSHKDQYDTEDDEQSSLSELLCIMLETSGKHIGGSRTDRGFDTRNESARESSESLSNAGTDTGGDFSDDTAAGGRGAAT
jgi:hypothetical protein